MFKVLTALVNGQWDDCWEENGRLMRFDTRQEAQEAIDEHVADYAELIGSEALTQDDFKIEEYK